MGKFALSKGEHEWCGTCGRSSHRGNNATMNDRSHKTARLGLFEGLTSITMGVERARALSQIIPIAHF